MEKQFYENINVIDGVEKDNFKIEILEYNALKGSKDPRLAKDLYYIQKAGLSLRQVKVTLDNGGVVVEPGALYFHKGNISCEANIGGVGGLAKKMLKNKEFTSKAPPEAVAKQKQSAKELEEKQKLLAARIEDLS